MDKKKLETFKKRLETRQVELRRTVTRTQADGRLADEDTAAADIADRAASSYTKEFLFHQSNNDRQLLQMVDGALEGSNVNISAEFSNLIIAQRAFEASSKAVTTFDTVTQETINMIH